MGRAADLEFVGARVPLTPARWPFQGGDHLTLKVEAWGSQVPSLCDIIALKVQAVSGTWSRGSGQHCEPARRGPQVQSPDLTPLWMEGTQANRCCIRKRECAQNT